MADSEVSAMSEGHGIWARVGSALFYGISSILIIFVNKIVLTNYRFSSYMFLGLGQMVATILVLFVGKVLGFVAYPSPSRDMPKRIFPLPVLYVFNLVSGLGSTKRLNLPMFTVLRRFSIFMTMVLEFFILGVKANFAVQFSVGLMLLGAFIAALNDLAFDSLGYTLILINDLCTAANGVYMKQKLDAKDLGKNGLLFYNSLFMLLPAILIAHYMGDLESALAYESWTNPGFLTGFCLSCICGFILNYSIILCTNINSALTTTCVGPIKNLVVTYAGMFMSGDYIFTWTNFIGINVSVLGSIIYTYVVFRTKKTGAGPPAPPIPEYKKVAAAERPGKHLVFPRDPATVPML